MSSFCTGWRGAGLAFLLSVCGGGASGPVKADPTPVLPAAPTLEAVAALEPEPTPAPAPDAGVRGTCQLAGFQSELLALVNRVRAAGAHCGSEGRLGPAPALRWNATLALSALRHSDDMQARNFFGHTGSDGSNAGQRMAAAGYHWRAWGENVAGGQPSVAAVVDGWLASPGHCANLLRPAFTDVAVACVPGGAGNTYRSYWTMDLATPR